MIIYLEGVDGSGKSTLAAVIAKRLEEVKTIRKIKYVANGEDLIPTNPNKPNRLTTEELGTKLIQMVQDLTTVYICDRGPISDIIYRTFDEFEPVMNLDLFWKLWFFNAHLFIIVYCNNNKSLELMLERGDSNPIAVNKHKELEYLYSQIIELFCPVHYDFETDDANEKINLIFAELFKNRDTYLKGENKQ